MFLDKLFKKNKKIINESSFLLHLSFMFIN